VQGLLRHPQMVVQKYEWSVKAEFRKCRFPSSAARPESP
jgi:hypothetical protein